MKTAECQNKPQTKNKIINAVGMLPPHPNVVGGCRSHWGGFWILHF